VNLLKDWFQWKINTNTWTIRINWRESKERRIRSRTVRETEDNKRRKKEKQTDFTVSVCSYSTQSAQRNIFNHARASIQSVDIKYSQGGAQNFAATGTVTFYCLWWGHVWHESKRVKVWRLPPSLPTVPERRTSRSMCRHKSGWGPHIPICSCCGNKTLAKGLMLKMYLRLSAPPTVESSEIEIRMRQGTSDTSLFICQPTVISVVSKWSKRRTKQRPYNKTNIAYKLKPVTQNSKSNTRIEFTPVTAIIHFIPACFMNHSWKELSHQNLQLQSRQITTENSTWLRSIGSDRSITSSHTFTIPRERTSVRLCRPLLAQRITNYYGNAKEPKSLTHHRIFMDFDKFVQNICLLAYDRTFCLQVCNNADCLSARLAVLIQLLLLKMCRWGAFQVVYISCTRSEELTHSLVLIALILRPKVATKKTMTILARV
jgi:hypothetical protein